MPNPLYETLLGKHLGRQSTFLYSSDGSEISYSSFLQLAAQLGHVFVEYGLVPGDRVALQVEKSPAALAIYAACAQAGLVILPLNTTYTAKELVHFLGDSRARLLVCDGRSVRELEPIAAAQRCRLESLNIDGSGTVAEHMKSMPKTLCTADRTDADLAAILYTSGTTGKSKGAMLSHRNLVVNAETLAGLWQFTDADTLLHALPIFHTHGLFVGTNVTLAAGGSMIFLPRFDRDVIIELLPKATVLMGVPTFYTRLLKDPRFTRELVAHMRLFISGSAPLSAETHHAFEDRTGHRILERYGMTETNMIASNPYDGERRAGTVGFPLPGIDLRITDPGNGSQISSGEVGLIEVRGESVFPGYWNNPDKTKEDMRADGFFATGDLGLIDDDGYLNILGRVKDLIISGGYNIYPKEVEQVLDAQPGVLESAVVGIPHPDLGEAVFALLVPEDDTMPDLDAIGTTLWSSLARFKHPRRLVVIDELPRNAMGKVQKNLLREKYLNSFE